MTDASRGKREERDKSHYGNDAGVVVIVGAALMCFMVCKMVRPRAYIRAPRTTDEEDDMRTAFLQAVSSYL